MAREMTVQEFMKILNELPTKFERQFGRFTLYLATQVRREAIRNVQKTFRKTRRLGAGGNDIAGVRGSLAGSVQLGIVGRWPGVTIGGPTVPYAVIHEFGGTITPKKARSLTIPVDPYYQGKRAREFSTLIVLGRKEEDKGVLFDTARDAVAYVLRKSATIPARPYLAPAMQKVANDSATNAEMNKLLGEKS